MPLQKHSLTPENELLLITSVIQELHLPLFKQASVDPLGNNKNSRGTVQAQKLL